MSKQTTNNHDSESAYLAMGSELLETESSILISSSKYLNNPRMRDVVANEMLRKLGTDVPPAYFIPDRMKAFEECTDIEFVFNLLESEKADKPEFAAWLNRRKLASISKEDLVNYEPGTLGHEVHKFLVATDFDLDFMFKGEPEDDYQYFLKRFIQNHDMMHMVTGFDLSPLGEAGLVMLSMACYFDYFSSEFAAELSKFNGLSIASEINRALLHYPASTVAVFDYIEMGRQMARNMNTPFFLICWEDHLEKTIDQIRAEFNIVGCPTSENSD